MIRNWESVPLKSSTECKQGLFKESERNQMSWAKPVVALGMPRQEDCYDLEASLSYIRSYVKKHKTRGREGDSTVILLL